MSSHNRKDEKRKKLEKNKYSEEAIIDFASKYEITYESDKEKLVSDLAIKGQNLIKDEQFEESEEICDFLLTIGKQWKDDFTKMKAYLLKAQLGPNISQESIPHLSIALSLAKKLRYDEIIVGVRIQLAYEHYHKKVFKKVLKEIKEVEKYEPLGLENLKVICELKSRCYWESDDYVKGFDATYKWFGYLKETDDIHSMFIVIVYLLTVVSSMKLPITEAKIGEIKNEIGQVLASLATSPHNFQELIPNIDVLFAKSLMMVQPEILYEFTEMFLQTVRWMDEEKYLYSCLKLADAFYSINDTQKAIEIIDKGKLFIKDKKYDKLNDKISLKKVEFTSLIFYFMSFDPLYDPFSIKGIKITEDDYVSEYYLQTFYSPINSYASTSYSHFLRILEKTKSNRLVKERSLEIQGLTLEEERKYFILRLVLADNTVNLLFREDFQIDETSSYTLHSTVSPFYSIVGILSSENDTIISDMVQMETILLEIQRAINCPASIVEIIFPKKHPQLNLLKFSSNVGGFNDLKVKILSCALSLKHKYPFLRDPKFLQIFQSDPITIFDFSLRESQQLEPLADLLRKAYGLNISKDALSDLFQDTMELFLKKGDTRFWKDFFYQFAWLQQRGTYLKLTDEQHSRKAELADHLIYLADKLQEEEKVLESRYFRLLFQLKSGFKDYQEHLDKFKQIAVDFQNEKYQIIFDILERLFKSEDLSDDTNLSTTLEMLCALCSSKDWEKTLELFLYFVSKVQDMSVLLEICQTKQIEDTGFLIYLHLTKRLIANLQYDSAYGVLKWLVTKLIERKTNFELPEHTWKYLFVTSNIFLFDLLEHIDEDELKTINFSKDKILDNLLENYQWIIKPEFLVELLLEKILLLLQRNDFALAENLYTWIEQLMFYHWNIFSSEENKLIIDRIQEIKKKIVSQHFT
ncbi:MAG: hypothetical protein KGD64_10610 [Candidatus Heimdallarchaeota archaeon]|nr:hypothetical protein [Candidatus Heimdallarchaeota archaeon]